MTTAAPKSESRVYGLLASGTDTELMNFHQLVSLLLNGIHRRAQTVHYACMSEHVEIAREAARLAGVTLERIDRDEDGAESYFILWKGNHAGWGASVRDQL